LSQQARREALRLEIGRRRIELDLFEGHARVQPYGGLSDRLPLDHLADGRH